MDASVHMFSLALQVFLLDLLLSGDNAVVIALACRALPEQQRRRAIAAGTAGAIVGRVLLTLVASLLMRVPLLKLVGGLALLVIAIRLLRDESPEGGHGEASAPADFWSALTTVIVADVIMSTDNVVALAALSKGSVAVLVLGLLGSVPFLMYGSWWVTQWLQRYPILVRLGGALLGWVAGDVAMSDPLYGAWVEQQAPALQLVVPALSAAYVLLQTRIIDANAAAAQELRPAPLVRRRVEREEPTDDMAVSGFAPASSGGVSLSEPSVQAALASTPEAVLVAVEGAASEPTAAGTDSLAAPEPARAPPAEPVGHAASPAVVALATGPETAEPSEGAVHAIDNPPLWRSAGAWLALGGAAVVVGAIVVLRGMDFMPTPKDLMRYDCAQGGVSIYYRFGGNRIRIESANASASGSVRADNQIDWGDLHAASRALGFVPPTRLLNASAYSLGIDGGMFEQVACTAR